MKLERADYLNFAKAGLIVAAIMLGLVSVMFLMGRVPQSWGDKGGVLLTISVLAPYLSSMCLLLLAVPGAIVFVPFILRNGHNAWDGYVILAVVINWVLYTWSVKRLLERRQRTWLLRRQ